MNRVVKEDSNPAWAFPDQQSCIDRLEWLRWGGRPRCPKCGRAHVKRRADPRRTDRWVCHKHRCRSCFSASKGTIFHGTRVPLPIWFEVIRAVVNEDAPITPSQVARRFGIRHPAASRMITKIRRSIEAKGTEVLRRIVDATSHQGSGMRDQEGSGIRDQGSGIRDQGSGIRDQGSGYHSGQTLSNEEFVIPAAHPRFVRDHDGLLGTVFYRHPERAGEQDRVLPTMCVREFMRLGGCLRYKPFRQQVEKGWLVVGCDKDGNEYPVYSPVACRFRMVRSLDAASAYIERMGGAQ